MVNLDFSLSPNPASTITNIACETPIENISVINLAGQVVKNINVNNENLYPLDVENLQTGVYIVSATLMNGELLVKKLIIQ